MPEIQEGDIFISVAKSKNNMTYTSKTDDMEYLPEDIQRRIESQEARIHRVWEERKAVAAAAGRRRVPCRPSIYTYGQGEGMRYTSASGVSFPSTSSKT